jgi:hypothetical protein
MDEKRSHLTDGHFKFIVAVVSSNMLLRIEISLPIETILSLSPFYTVTGVKFDQLVV